MFYDHVLFFYFVFNIVLQEFKLEKFSVIPLVISLVERERENGGQYIVEIVIGLEFARLLVRDTNVAHNFVDMG